MINITSAKPRKIVMIENNLNPGMWFKYRSETIYFAVRWEGNRLFCVGFRPGGLNVFYEMFHSDPLDCVTVIDPPKNITLEF